MKSLLAPVVLVAALSATGCGAAADPNVLGTWRTSGATVSVNLIGTTITGVVTGTLVFSGSATSGTFTDDSTIAVNMGGCSLNVVANGTFTDTALTYSAQYTAGSYSVTGCTDAANNVAMTAFTPADVAAINAGLVGTTATLSATTLPFRWFNNALTYTRA